MNVESLHLALQQSFSADSHIRQPAENIIKNLKKVEGAVTLPLQVVAEKQVRSCSECIDGRVILSNSCFASFFTLYSTGPIRSKTSRSDPIEEHLQGMLGGESECFDWTVTIP